MKYLISTILTLNLIFMHAQTVKQERIKEQKTIEVLSLSALPNVEIRQGESLSVLVETEQEYQKFIEVEVKDKILTICVKNNQGKEVDIVSVVVTLPNQDLSIQANAVSNLFSSEVLSFNTLELQLNATSKGTLKVKTNTFNLNANACSSFELQGSTETSKMSINACTDFNASELKIKDLDLYSNVNNKIKVFVTDTLKLKEQLSNVEILGNPTVIKKK